MLLAQIEGFIEIALQGNMRRAAARPLDQPAGAHRPDPGARGGARGGLFRRTHSGMVLTPAGRAFLPHADRAIEAIRSGGSLVRELEYGSPVSSPLRSPLQSAPTSCRRSWFGSPSYTRMSACSSGPAIRRDPRSRGPREVELGISAAPRRTVTQPSALRGRARPCRPAGPSLRHRGPIDVSEISHAQLILFDRTSSYYDLTNAMFRAAGVTPRGITEVDNIEAAKRMVERGPGVALLPGTAVADALAAGSVREVGLVGAAAIRRQIVAVERLGARRLAVLDTLWDLLERIPELIPRALPILAGD